jgi:ABC-type transporter Mla subunit MlaD
MMGQPQGFAPQQMAPPVDMESVRRTIETINYKLDSLKAALDAINARLANIESAMRTTPGQQGGFY